MHICKETLGNEMQHRQIHTHNNRARTTSTVLYLHWPTSGSISQGLCALGKLPLTTIGSINKFLHEIVMACAHYQGDIGMAKLQ